ncbi:ABC transporter permease subunit [Streptomyces buecherae]|uniref:ABC transporter permease subunit n=1 Tax=Streptomyces buecherae TaxID=2763006 RepID=UPI001C26F6C8|nr:ABC transporter permease [Streptomyces buecherae]
MTTPQQPHPAPAAPQQQPAPHQQVQTLQAPQPQPQQGQPQAGGGFAHAGYTSPIPIRPTHIGHALASEWTKIKSVRSTMWTLTVMVALVVGIGLLTSVGIAGGDTDLEGESPLAFGFFGMLLGVLCVITLGVLAVSSEYSTGMIRTTLTACPSRSRVLAAKAIVFFALTFVVTLACTAVVGFIGDSMLSDNPGAGETGGSAWFKATVGVSLYVALLGLLALSVGSMLRHSAGAITIMIGVVLLPLVLALFMRGDALEDVREALFEYSVPSQLGIMFSNTVVDSGPSGWDPLLIILVVTGAALAAAFSVLEKRDV